MKKTFNYPSEEVLQKMDKKLAKMKGSLMLPQDAGPIEVLKHDTCAYFVRYRREQNLTQKQLAKKLDVSEARMSEILHYRHKRFTADYLLRLLHKLRPNLKIKVA